MKIRRRLPILAAIAAAIITAGIAVAQRGGFPTGPIFQVQNNGTPVSPSVNTLNFIDFTLTGPTQGVLGIATSGGSLPAAGTANRILFDNGSTWVGSGSPTLSGTLTVQGNTIIDGNTTIGNTLVDTATINATSTFNSDIILGDNDAQIRGASGNNIVLTSFQAAGSVAAITLNSNATFTNGQTVHNFLNNSTEILSLVAGTAANGTSRFFGGLRIDGALDHDGTTVGFYGITPTARPSAITQTYSTTTNEVLARTAADLTDNTGGTASTTLAAGVGEMTVAIPINLASVTGAGDIVTSWLPGYAFAISTPAFFTTTPSTGGGGNAFTTNFEINTTDIGGCAVTVTLTDSDTLGEKIVGSTCTGTTTGTSADFISIEASSVTAFTGGSGFLLVKIRNRDDANAFASLAKEHDDQVVDSNNTTQVLNQQLDYLQLVGILQ